MDIQVSGRHFNLSDAEKQKAVSLIRDRFAGLPVKIISASVVLDVQGNRCIAEVVVNAKNDLTAAAQVEDFDLNKALEAAALKAETQIRKYLSKRKHHKNGKTLVQLEEMAGNAEK